MCSCAVETKFNSALVCSHTFGAAFAQLRNYPIFQNEDFRVPFVAIVTESPCFVLLSSVLGSCTLGFGRPVPPVCSLASRCSYAHALGVGGRRHQFGLPWTSVRPWFWDVEEYWKLHVCTTIKPAPTLRASLAFFVNCEGVGGEQLRSSSTDTSTEQTFFFLRCSEFGDVAAWWLKLTPFFSLRCPSHQRIFMPLLFWF